MLAFPLSVEFLRSLRNAAREFLPGVGAAHIAEATAAALGFRTNAALRSHCATSSKAVVVPLDDARFVARLNELMPGSARAGILTGVALEVIAIEVIDRAHRRNQEAAERPRNSGTTRLGASLRPFERREARQALHDFLASLPHSTLLMIQAVMYVGRDGGTFKETLQHLIDLGNDPGDVARHIGEKTALDRYLSRGLHHAKVIGLERMWQSDDALRGRHNDEPHEVPKLLMRHCIECGDRFESTGGENIYCDDCFESLAED